MIVDITTFTLIHTLISLVAIAAGLVVVSRGVRLTGFSGQGCWNPVFLPT